MNGKLDRCCSVKGYKAVCTIWIVLILFCMFLSGCSSKSTEKDAWRETFEYLYGEKYWEEFCNTDCREEDKETLEPLLLLADEAMSFCGTEEEADMRFGTLSTYCPVVEAYPTMYREVHTLVLLKAKLEEDRGYMWISYEQEGWNEQGERIYYSEVPAVRWTLYRVDDEWKVSSILEAL